jgi:adenylate kinase
MECDVVIYDITQDVNQVEEASWAIEAVSSQLDIEKPKTFILLSSVMTWAKTKPVDPVSLASFLSCRPRYIFHCL